MADFLIGIDVGGTNIKMLIMDISFNVIGHCSIATQPSLGYEAVSDNIIAALNGILNEKGISKNNVVAIGMGLPGIVDMHKQETVRLALLKWDGFNPCKKIGQYYNAPYIIDNDANVNVLGEYHFGLHRKIDNLVLLTLGTGVGCGLIVEGKIYHGANNLATELGHMTIVADGGEICLYGQRGHLEAYCSGTAMRMYSKKMMDENTDTILHKFVSENNGVFDNKMIDEGIAQGDTICKHIMERFVHYLAVGCGNIMKIFNPELILLGGGISNAGSLILDPLNKETIEYVIHPSQHCIISKAKLGEKTGIYGACIMAAESIGL